MHRCSNMLCLHQQCQHTNRKSQPLHTQPQPAVSAAINALPYSPALPVYQPSLTMSSQPMFLPPSETQCTTLQAPYAVQPLRQPVPVPELPKLVHDSEREFADLTMALDHLLNPHTELSEHYKYRVLMEHLVLDEAKLIAQSCRHYVQPYTAAMQALQRHGPPH